MALPHGRPGQHRGSLHYLWAGAVNWALGILSALAVVAMVVLVVAVTVYADDMEE